MSRRKRILKMMLGVIVFFFIVFATGLWWLIRSLSPGYEVTDGRVFFRSFDNMKWQVERVEVLNADPSGIRTIRGSGGLYGADENRVFFEGREIEEADPNSFQILDWRESFSRDAQHVFCDTRRISDDAENFVVLTRGYAKDSHHVYYAAKTVEDADPDTFVVTGTATSHARDKNHQFNMGRKTE